MDASETPFAESQGPHSNDAPHRRWFRVSAYLIVLLVWPVLALLRTPADPLAFVWQIESDRLGAYTASAIFLWSMFALIWLIQRLDRQRLHHLGYNAPHSRDFLFGVTFLVAVYPLLGGLAWALAALGLPIPEIVIKALLPVTATERLAWIGLSITAAVCEETVFRGYLLVRGEAIVKSRGLAIALSAAAFGIGHYYQDWGGVILITIYGLLFAWLRFRTGTLWACIVAHALQDILAVYLGALQNG